MKVALLAAMPAPYRLPVWNALAQRVGELHVLFCSHREANRVWEIAVPEDAAWRSTVLPGLHRYVNAIDWGFHFNPTVLRELRRLEPDAIVVSGWDSPTYVTALLYGRARGIPVVMQVESHRLTSQVRRGPIAFARGVLARMPDAVIAHGRLAGEYVRELGVPESRICHGPLTADVRRFGEIADETFTPLQPGDPVRMLFVGRLTESKGLPELLKAFDALPAGEAELTIVGYGPLEGEVKRRAAAPGSPIRFLGATGTVAATARAYGAADVMVMPTHRDVWGIVVNEALAAGVYVLGSRFAGATADLVQDAPLDVGTVIDPTDPENLRRSLVDACAKVRAGGVDRKAIARWGRSHTPERLADVFVEALKTAGKRRSAP